MITIIVLCVLAAASGVLFSLSGRVLPDFRIGRALIYAAVFVLLFGVSALLFLSNLPLTTIFWILFGLFLIAGVIHTRLLHRRFPWAQPDLFLTELMLTLLIYSLGTALLGGLYRQITSGDSVTFLAGAGSAFLIPFFFHKSLHLWKAVPPPYYYKWFFPTQKEVPILTFQDTIPLQFSFQKETDNEKPTTFSVVAPTDIRLGELFHSFLVEYNQQFPDSPVQSYKPPFAWTFHTLTGKWWRPKKVIDPDVTISENHLKPNEEVNAVRVR